MSRLHRRQRWAHRIAWVDRRARNRPAGASRRTAFVDGSLIAQIKVLRARESAKTLHDRIIAFLSREKKPELADVRVVYGPGDFDRAMPRFVTAFLASRFAAQPLKAAR